jgi:hypothetical protein
MDLLGHADVDHNGPGHVMPNAIRAATSAIDDALGA